MEQAFLDAIIAAPDDDAPRLIMADWLDEQGQNERAEFVRIQIELATYGEYRCPYHAGLPDMLWGYPVVADGETEHECKWCRLKKRERDLLLTTKPGQWSRFPKELHIAVATARDCGPWTFRRGFVEVIQLTSEHWLQHADELTRLAPLREVELTTRLAPLREVLKARWPNIEFTLPPSPHFGRARRGQDFADAMALAMDAVAWQVRLGQERRPHRPAGHR